MKLGLLKPSYCPYCGSENIEIEYDNVANGSYEAWYNIKCQKCSKRTHKCIIYDKR